MKRITKISGRSGGFTLVELLTVMAVIALLIGLLVPALNTARKYAKDVRQRAQLHGIEAALEAFHGDYGDYPPSTASGITPDITVGAQKLAEAIAGLDLRGFDPVSTFDIKYTLETMTVPPAPYFPYAVTGDDEQKSLKNRKGPYIKIDENVGIYNIDALFPGTLGEVYRGEDPKNREFGPVICDTFKVKNIQVIDPTDSLGTATITVKAGTPILYYKANSSSKVFPDPQTNKADIAKANTYIYNILDNATLVELGVFTKSTLPNDDHHFDKDYTDPDTSLKGVEIFYNKITNRKVSAKAWPYNPDTYILISAGYDGIYGTDDDICNFSGE